MQTQNPCNLETEECIPIGQCMVRVINNTLVVEGNTCGEGHVCCKKDENLKSIKAPCGFRNELGLGVYGTNVGKLENQEKFAELAEFPWIVSIEKGGDKICTGSLINEKVVMTSANCFMNKKISDSMQVRVGAWKNSAKIGIQTENLHEISQIIYHDENVNRYQPNIAYLLLATPVDMNMFVGTVCLSPSLENLAMDDCLAVGWKSGQSTSEELSIEENLQLQPCEDLMDPIKTMIPEQAKCARSVKNLEKGSAVVCRINSTESNYQQVGIVLHDPLQTSHIILVDVSKFAIGISEIFQSWGIANESFTFSHINSRGFFSSFKSFLHKTSMFLSDPDVLSYSATIGKSIISVLTFAGTVAAFTG